MAQQIDPETGKPILVHNTPETVTALASECLLTDSGNVYLRGRLIGRSKGLTPMHIQDVLDAWGAAQAEKADL